MTSSADNGAGIPLPEKPADVTREWLREALAAGAASAAAEVDSVAVEPLSDVVNAMGNLSRCRVTAPGGGAADPATVILKLPTTNPLALRLANWLAIHRREYVFYRDVAPHTDLKAPALLYGDYDERSHRFVLLLEDLGGMQAVPQGDGVGIERARRAIREIATFQARFWEAGDDPALAACGPFLTPGQRRIMQTLYLLTLPPALERFGELFTDDTRRLAEAFGTRIDAHFAAVAQGPGTIVHGDFRGDNVLFGREGEDDFAVIDWQGCGFGCGMYDVAFFLATSVTIEDRRALERDAVNEYHEIVSAGGAKNYSQDDCWRSYRQNMLATLMPMVLGAGGIDIEDESLKNQTRKLLRRTVTAIEDLDSGEFLPPASGLFSSIGAFSALSRGGFRAYRGLLGLRKKKGG